MSQPSLSQHCPSPAELNDLELLISGAYAPLTVFNAPQSPVQLALPPTIALMSFVLGLNLLADALREQSMKD